MSNYKVEITVNGQLIGPRYFITLEGHQINLMENPANVYKRAFEEFPVDGPLDVHIALRGVYGRPYKVLIKVRDKEYELMEGHFPIKGVVSVSRQINLANENV
jgi:hypothetical protein